VSATHLEALAQKHAESFKADLGNLLNRYGLDDFCGIPDYILADHLSKVLVVLKHTAWQVSEFGEEEGRAE
jgi:hypothetical protein